MKKILIVLSLVCLEATALANAKIEAIGGATSVSIKRGGKKITVKTGVTLSPGDEVMTGENQAVDLRFSDRSLVRLGSNTVYRVGPKRHNSPWDDELMNGFLRALAPEKKKAEKSKIKLRLKTATGTIGVRGTEFTLEADSGRTELRALHGAVLFGPANADFSDLSKFVVVLRGHRSEVKKGEGKPSMPRTFNLDDYIRKLDAKVPGNPLIGLSDRRSGTKKFSVAAKKAEPDARKEKLKPVLKDDGKKNEKVETKSLDEQFAEMQERLLEAVRNDEVEVVEDLMSQLGGEGLQLESGESMLHVAAAYNSHLTMQLLIDRGVNVDVKNSRKETPLMYAAGRSGSAETALLLLQNGADPMLEDADHKTALDLAKDKKYDEIVEIIESEISKSKDD